MFIGEGLIEGLKQKQIIVLFSLSQVYWYGLLSVSCFLASVQTEYTPVLWRKLKQVQRWVN